MIFDTGAQISFFQHDSRIDFSPAGDFSDFHPTFGNFQTDTYHVPVLLGGKELVVRCGVLNDPQLCATLTAAGVQGIVGNEVLGNRIVCYFPRRNIMVISGEKPKANQPKWQNVLVTCSHGDCCEPGAMIFHRLICPDCENVVWKVTQTRDEKYPMMTSTEAVCPDCGFTFHSGDKCLICKKGASFYHMSDYTFPDEDFVQFHKEGKNKCLVSREEYILQFKAAYKREDK